MKARQQHSVSKPWWAEVSDAFVQWLPDEAAGEAETAAIQRERPMYNQRQSEVIGQARRALHALNGGQEPEPVEVSLDDMQVTFTSGAALLVELGIVPNMTREGVRMVSKRDREWPFGEGRQYPYGELAGAQTMAAVPFVEFFRNRVVLKRGPDKKPRSRRSQPPSRQDAPGTE